MNNYIVRSYRDVIVVTKIATRRYSKAQYSHVLKVKTKNIIKNINKINRITIGQFSKVLFLLIMHTAPQRALDYRPGLGFHCFYREITWKINNYLSPEK